MTILKNGKTSLFLALAMLLTIFSSGIACANSANAQTLQLEKYLTAIQNKDSKTAAELCIDKRLSGDSEEIASLNNLFQDLNLQVKSYKILYEKEIQYDESSIFAVKISYINGKIEQVPFLVQKENNNWSVIVDSEFADKSMYTLIKEGTEIYSDQYVLNSLDASNRLTTWNNVLDVNGSPKVYTSTFNVTANQVTLNYRQWGTNGTLGTEYAIVNYSLFYDIVYASGTVYANNQYYANQMVLSCGSRSGVCLRIQLSNTGSSAGTTYGEVYNQ